MTPTTRSDGLPECTCAAKMKIPPASERHASWCPVRRHDNVDEEMQADDDLVTGMVAEDRPGRILEDGAKEGEAEMEEHLADATAAPGPPSAWKSRIELVNELLDQAEVARKQALLTPHNQGLLAKLVPLLGRAARALEIREQGLPIFLGTSERTTNLIGWVKTNDPKITQEVMASSAILPTVVMGGDDRDEPVIVAFGLVLRTMVDTRPNVHLGEGDPDDDLKQVVQNLIAAAERFMETADPLPPAGVDRSLELSNAISEAKRATP